MQSKVEEFFAIFEKIASTCQFLPRCHADSRDIQKGDVFFALKGKHTDGHFFIKQAVEKGASLCIVEKLCDECRDLCFEVESVTDFLKQVANYRLKQIKPYLIGITGSCGKTTTKHFLYSLLKNKKQTFATFGNFNSQLGIPLCLISMPKSTEVAIIEMGMSQAGDIAKLREWIDLDMSITVSIGLAHVENFKDKQEGIARAKAEIMQRCPVNIFNEYTACFEPYRNLATPYLVETKAINVDCEGVYFTLAQKKYGPFFLQIQATHILENLHLVLAALNHLGFSPDDFKQQLQMLSPEKGRLDKHHLRGAQFIDDSYNASPTSMQSSLQYFQTLNATRKLAVIGSMRELGDECQKEHLKLYPFLNSGIEHIFFIGEETLELCERLKEKSSFYKSLEDLLISLKEKLKVEDLVLIKGSHSTGLHTLISKLKQS
jgi:UDP-N-acetylmuramoyl-tripeptide--D-alanyl-D-alanine ligase